MQIKWLRLALSDLDKIFDYIASDNPEAATHIVDTIWQNSKILAKHPQAGREGRVYGTRELYIVNTSYILPYRVKNNSIEILRVLHTSQNWPQSFNP